MLLAMCMLLGMLSPNMSAQGMSNADITGKVVDQYGNPVSDVTVTMKNSNFKAVTGFQNPIEERGYIVFVTSGIYS